VSAAQLEKLQATRLPLQGQQPKSVCHGIASKSASPRFNKLLFLKKRILFLLKNNIDTAG
jgi:hypothetical protein